MTTATPTMTSTTATVSHQVLLEETMRKYNIDQPTLAYWEEALGLRIQTDAQGNKLYSQQHIALFKNIKKYMALGRSLQDIRAMIMLPPDETATVTPVRLNPTADPKPYGTTPVGKARAAQPVNSPAKGTITDETDEAELSPASRPVMTAEPAGSQGSRSVLGNTVAPSQGVASVAPLHPVTMGTATHAGNNAALQLVEKLIAEKDELHRKLVEAEKLNSHLYNVNNLFHRKVKELTALVGKLKANNQEKVNMKLMDDKARLHRQLLETERTRLDQQRELDGCYKNIHQLQKELVQNQQQLRNSREAVSAGDFLGQWQEEAQLSQIVYDQFGINVEPQRSRQFSIEEAPSCMVGDTAIMRQQYHYDSNALWQRQETLVLSLINKTMAQGELQVDYWLDNAPVCRALYQVTLTRLASGDE